MVVLSNILILGIMLWAILLLGDWLIMFVNMLQTGSTEQIVDYFSNFSFWDLFNFPSWDMSALGSTIKTIIIVFFVIVFLVLLVMRENLFAIKPFMDKYQRESYTTFQNHFERKRALYRVMYNDKGGIFRGGLEGIYDRIFDPVLKFQNKVMSYYNRPIYEFWNRQVEHKIPKSKPIDSLIVIKPKQNNEPNTKDKNVEVKEDAD